MSKYQSRAARSGGRGMCFCFTCNRVQSYSIEECPDCGGKMRTLGNFPRPPKRRASKMRWKAFWRVFAGRLTEAERKILKIN